MYCPGCGQEQITEETRFCSRCGLLLTVIAEIMNNGGALPQNLAATEASSSKFNSLRKKGVKQGLFIFLLAFLVVPVTAVIAIALGAGPFPIAIAAILLSIGGLLRMIYAWMFEADEPVRTDSEPGVLSSANNYFGKTKADKGLPPEQSIPVSSYLPPPKQGNWRETNDLAQPSVVEQTTKLLRDE